MQADGTTLSSVGVLKNSKLFNTESSKALPFIGFLDVIRAIVSYSRTFYEFYAVPFHKTHLYDVRRDIESASFILGEPNSEQSIY